MSELAEGFRNGLLHPLLAPAHVLVLIGLGLAIGRQSAGRIEALVAFVAGVMGGLIAVASAVAVTFAREVLLVLAAIEGIVVALALPLDRLRCVLLAGMVGAAIGLDSAPEVVSLRLGSAMLIGAGIGACFMLAVASSIAGGVHSRVGAIPLRVLGSWCAASAMLVLALRFAGR